MNRRDFISHTSMGMGLLAPSAGLNIFHPEEYSEKQKNKMAGPIKISVFSKHLQWLDYIGMAETAAKIGFDGIDLTVRPGGHVLPERVSDDLPKAVEAVKKCGLQVYSIVTSIDNAEDPLSTTILQTAKRLNIAHYRLGWFHYDQAKSIDQNLLEIGQKLKGIEALNTKIGVYGSYQNHEGHYFGAPIWDLATLLKQMNAMWTGSQYDVYHATIEGAHSWIYGFELLSPFIKTINIKDYQWAKKNGKWETESVPLGEGVVDFSSYFGMLKKSGIYCPVSLHLEYPIGGADQGAKTLTVAKDVVTGAMKSDLGYLKSKMREAGLLE